jgi:hypothetical protein
VINKVLGVYLKNSYGLIHEFNGAKCEQAIKIIIAENNIQKTFEFVFCNLLNIFCDFQRV